MTFSQRTSEFSQPNRLRQTHWRGSSSAVVIRITIRGMAFANGQEIVACLPFPVNSHSHSHSLKILIKSDALIREPSTFLWTDHNVPPLYSNDYVIWEPRNTRWWQDTDTTLWIHIVRDILVQNRNIWLLKYCQVWFDIPGIVGTHVVPDPVPEGLLKDNPTNWYPVWMISTYWVDTVIHPETSVVASQVTAILTPTAPSAFVGDAAAASGDMLAVWMMFQTPTYCGWCSSLRHRHIDVADTDILMLQTPTYWCCRHQDIDVADTGILSAVWRARVP